MDLDSIFDQTHGNAAPAQESAAAPSIAQTASAPMDLDSIFSAVHGDQSVVPVDQEPTSIWDRLTTRPSGEKIGLLQSVAGPVLSMGDWLGADEGTAAINALIDKAQGGDFSSSYDKYLTGARGAIDSFRNASPTAAIGLDIAGGIKMIPSAISKAPTLIAKTVQAAKEGAAVGGLYGFGTGRGGAESRLKDAGKGAALGTATGIIATPLVEGVAGASKKALDWLAEKGISATSFVDDLKGRFASQRGAIGENAADSIEGLTRTDIELARQLKQQSADDILSAELKMESAASRGQPLFLPEALNSADVYTNAKYIAKNNKASMKMAQDAIEARKDTAGERIGNLLNQVAREEDPASVGKGLINASQEVVDALAKVRKDSTAPLYKALESKSVPDDIAIDLLGDPVIEAAATKVSKNPAFAKEIGSAPVESFKSLQLIKQNLDDQVASLTRAGNNNEARIVAGSRDKLVGALEQLDEYKKVTETYRELSKPINRLAGTKEESGLLEGVLNTEAIKTHRAPAELLKLTPNQIEAVKESLGERGVTELRRSARSLFQDVLEKVNDGSQPAIKLLQNEQISAKFKAMLGEDLFNKVSKDIDLEKLMARANNKYLAGSDTAKNLAEAADSDQAMGILSQLSKKDWKGLVERVMGQPISDDVAQGMAQIYFNTEKGLSSLQKVKPLIEQYGKNARAIGQLAGAAESATARAAGPGVEEATRKPQKSVFKNKPSGKTIFSAAVPAAGAGALAMGPSKAEGQQPSGGMIATPTPTPQAQEFKNVASSEAINRALSSLTDGGKMEDTKAPVEDVQLDKAPAGTAADDLVQAVVLQESAGKKNAVSKAGAQGLMQLMPATGREWHKKLGIKEPYDPFDPEQNKTIGTAYLNYLLDMYDGDKELALTAYNQGFGRVNKLLARTKGKSLDDIIEFLGPDGQGYAKGVLSKLERIRKNGQVTA